MPKTPAPEFGSFDQLNFDQLQILASDTAKYEEAEEPEIVLRSGLIEEVYEYINLKNQGEPLSKSDLAGEIGDMLWYCSEIARQRGIRLSDAANGAGVNLDDYQASVAAYPQMSKIIDNLGREVDLRERPAEALAVAALRVADVMNPKNDELWNGYEQALELPQAIIDLLKCIAYTASSHGVKLSEAIESTLAKLRNRPRPPHVIEKAANKNLKSSMRYRLLIDPWVRALFLNVDS